MRWKLILVLVLLAGACGGDDDGDTSLFVPDGSGDADEPAVDDDPAPAGDDEPADDDPVPTGEDRSGQLIGTCHA